MDKKQQSLLTRYFYIDGALFVYSHLNEKLIHGAK